MPAGSVAVGRMMRGLLAARRRRPALASLLHLGAAPAFGVRAASTAPKPKPSVSALAASARALRDAFHGHEALRAIAAEAGAPVDRDSVVARLRAELAAGEAPAEVMLMGQALEAGPGGRRSITVSAPIGPSGGPGERKVTMPLPTAEDIQALIVKRAELKARIEKPQDAAQILEKYLTEQFLGKASDHVAMIAAWGPKSIPDSEGEFAEVAALMSMQLRAFKAALTSGKEDFQFEVSRPGDGRECLVMPPSNFALLGLKDTFKMLLQGFRVLAIVQPRFFLHFREVQKGLSECGLPEGMFEVLPGITPEADPAVLHEALKHVHRLQFTGSSAMFKSLVAKAYELGNLRLEHGGEVSGLNKVRLDGVSVSHPAVAAGSAWAAMANNGELCTSASLIEFDPATGDSPQAVKAALEGHAFKLGTDPTDTGLDVLLKEGKSSQLEVKTEIPAEGFREWWEKTILAVPAGSPPNLRTNQSLGHCIFAPSIAQALEAGVKEDASCVYCVGVPEDTSAPSARAGTTGCQLPESVFGGMKTYTYAVAGDHDGVGSVQTLLSTVKRRGPSWRDQEEVYAEYELTETAEDLLEFLSPSDQKPFAKQLASVLEVFSAFQPEVSYPYDGQPLVGGEGRSKLLTMAALKPARKNLLIPRGVGLPDDIIKIALLCEMSPLREVPVDLHVLGAMQAGKLRVTDPLKSFIRVVEKRLGWKPHYHADYEQLTAAVKAAEYPPYFFAVKDKHLLPVELLMAVAEQGGYLYEGLPADALSLFRWLTTTQAWTVACTEGAVGEAAEALRKAWSEAGLREVPHPAPELVQPSARADIGGGFSPTGFGDDKDWADLSDDDSSDSDDGGSAASSTPSTSAGDAGSKASKSAP